MKKRKNPRKITDRLFERNQIFFAYFIGIILPVNKAPRNCCDIPQRVIYKESMAI
jgi:hypothetical protein